MSGDQTAEDQQRTVDTETTTTRVEVLSSNMDDSLLARHPVQINHQMLSVPGSHDGAFGSNGSSKSRSSSVVSSLSAAEAMESDGDTPPEGSVDGAFTFDAKTFGVTTESLGRTDGESERLVPPEKILDPSDDDGRPLSGMSSCFDTDDDLLSDDTCSNSTGKKLGKRVGSKFSKVPVLRLFALMYSVRLLTSMC